ncbi:hypothetical protein ISS86_01240 [Candidatus Microgenomates bacterium]|nr:hypothetical protein [Candidatus Microgenomates bacterium]
MKECQTGNLNLENFDWLKAFNVDPATLDEETLEYARKLGLNGVAELREREAPLREEGILYRGEPITEGDRTRLLEQTLELCRHRVKWERGEKSIHGDKPADWILDEVKYLEGLR